VLGHSALGEQPLGSLEQTLRINVSFQELTLVGQTVTFAYAGGISSVVDSATLTYTAQNVGFDSPDIIIEAVVSGTLTYTPQNIDLTYGGDVSDVFDTATATYTMQQFEYGFGFSIASKALTYTPQNVDITYGGGATDTVTSGVLTYTPQEFNIIEGSIGYTTSVDSLTLSYQGQTQHEALTLSPLRNRAHAARPGIKGRVSIISGIRAS